MLVTIAGTFPHLEAMTPIEKPREGVIDMAGVGAQYSHGSDYFHLILTLEGEPAISNLAFDQALRTIGVRIARYLAGAEKSGAAPKRRKLHLGPVQKKLPKVVLIYQIQSQIPLVRTFYYGEELSRTLPFRSPKRVLRRRRGERQLQEREEDSDFGALRESFH